MKKVIDVIYDVQLKDIPKGCWAEGYKELTHGYWNIVKWTKS